MPIFHPNTPFINITMAQQRMALWAAEEIDEDLQAVDLSLAIGNYGHNGLYDDGVNRIL